MATKAFLAEIPLMAHENVGWRLKKGFAPYQRVFEMDPDGFDALMKKIGATGGAGNAAGGVDFSESLTDGQGSTYTTSNQSYVGVELRLEVDGVATASFKDLIVVSNAPASQPYLRAVVVTDKRWLWSRKLVEGSYNVRRRSGQKRWIPTGDGDLVDFVKVDVRGGTIDDIDYALYSLNNGKAWTAKDILKDVLNKVTGGKYIFDESIVTDQQPVENFELTDQGDSALMRVMAFIPGLSIYINNDGIPVVTSDYSLEDLDELNEAAFPLTGKPLVDYVSMELSRPSAVDVYFEIEEEYRFDFMEPETTLGLDDPYLENVLPLPDPALTINGNQYVQGTWVKIDDNLMTAWNTDRPAQVVFGGESFNLEPMSMTVLRDLWFTKGYNLYYECDLGTDALWARRMSALLQHYRQTFRINRRWVDRLRSFRPNRVSILDPETGVRAPSDVYTNYAQIPTKKRLARIGSDSTRLSAWQVTGYATNLKDGKVAPAVVQVVDEQVGIVRVEFRGDAFGDTMEMVPSAVKIRSDVQSSTGQTVPSTDIRDGVPVVLTLGALADDHSLAIVLTASPAAPADTRRLLRVRVTPNQAKEFMSNLAVIRLENSAGPAWQVKVGSGVVTARFGYTDSARTEIQNALLGKGVRDVKRLVNKDDIQAVARATAAAIYTGLIDRYEGSHVTILDPKRRPRGRIDSVAHELMPNGAAITQMDIPPDVKPVDIFAILPDSVRRIILRQVQR